jgi:hypothetical protein
VTYVIGTRLLPEPQTHANMGQMLRTLGCAQSLGYLAFIYYYTKSQGGFGSLIALPLQKGPRTQDNSVSRLIGPPAGNSV